MLKLSVIRTEMQGRNGSRRPSRSLNLRARSPPALRPRLRDELNGLRRRYSARGPTHEKFVFWTDGVATRTVQHLLGHKNCSVF